MKLVAVYKDVMFILNIIGVPTYLWHFDERKINAVIWTTYIGRMQFDATTSF